MVTLASTTPALQALVPDTTQLLTEVALAVKPWASAGSSAETIAWFVQLIHQKLRISSINSGNLDT